MLFPAHTLDAVCVVVAIIWVLGNIKDEASFHLRFVFLLRALLLQYSLAGQGSVGLEGHLVKRGRVIAGKEFEPSFAVISNKQHKHC